ncbi:transmembrane protein 186 [Adelges cooleyi]|uniref:transmembrane protein 186 n=1 Tax=Adelges cooleyi TaxID=133065 RepID=UPI00217F56D6|nr:transmembrane protein 186 [Adelges cooleyi]
MFKLYHSSSSKRILNSTVKTLKYSTPIFKTLKTDQTLNESITNYKPIFQTSNMPIFICLNKLKTIQTISNIIILPITYGLKVFDLLNFTEVMYLSLIGIGLTAGLYTSSWILSDYLVVFVYISDDEKKCRMSYISFWGARKELYCNVDDIQPIQCSKLDIFNNKVKIKNNNKTFKIVLPNSTIMNNAKLRILFGDEVI